MKHQKPLPRTYQNGVLLQFGAFLVHFFGVPKQEKPPLSAFRRGFCQNNGGEDEIPLRCACGISVPPAGVRATPLGSCSRRSFGPLVCFRYPPSGERAPRPPDNKNSQLLAQPAAWSQKGCGEDEIRTRGTE